MSQLESTSASPGVFVQKPKTTIYTVMLMVAVAAMLLACLFLWLEISSYGGLGAVQGRV